jgi:callose synthase
MSYEMHGVLSGAISLTTWEKVMPAYGNEPESFLNNVVTPIYNVIKKVLFNVSSFCFFGYFLQ